MAVDGGMERDGSRAHTGTTGRIVDAGRQLITLRGYNGFSFADVAEAVGIRKASVHHHFPAKADLAVAVVEQSRSAIRDRALEFASGTVDALGALKGYTDYWERCIGDGSASFCLAAVLAAEAPSLPPAVRAAVRAHFADLMAWLVAVLARGRQEGVFAFADTPEDEAERFMAAVYGAMLGARVFDDPARFGRMVRAFVRRLGA
jgi:TetR/AcrR family transcriptional repressor of nem operon